MLFIVENQCLQELLFDVLLNIYLFGINYIFLHQILLNCNKLWFNTYNFLTDNFITIWMRFHIALLCGCYSMSPIFSSFFSFRKKTTLCCHSRCLSIRPSSVEISLERGSTIHITNRPIVLKFDLIIGGGVLHV